MASVTRLGDFQMFLETNLHAKMSKIFGDFLGRFEMLHLQVKTFVLATFVATFGNVRTIFIPTSGHAVYG